jgi:steroid 5-alpha reductase family enzyme
MFLPPSWTHIPSFFFVLILQKQTKLPHLTIWHSSITILWGVRLFTFLTYREYVSWPALHQKVVEVQAKMNIPYASKLLCWLVYSFFYVALMASCWSRHRQAASAAVSAATAAVASETLSSSATGVWGVLGYIGLLMQSTGLILESVADMQKTAFKSRNHFTWCNVGLWRISTHPNYLGEGLFWLGTYLSHGFHSIFPSVLATAGLAFIMVVLKGSARSLASKQKEKYGQDPDFCDFQRSHNVFGPKHWSVNTPRSDNHNIIHNNHVDDATNGEERQCQ